MEGGVIIFLVIGFAAMVFGWASGKSKGKVENEFNRKLRIQLENKEKEIRKKELDSIENIKQREIYSLKILEDKHNLLNQTKIEFNKSFIQGRKWLAEYLIEAEKIQDIKFERFLIYKIYSFIQYNFIIFFNKGKVFFQSF